MRLIRWSANLGFVRGDIKGRFEVEDETTDDDIDDMVFYEASQRIQISWNEEEK